MGCAASKDNYKITYVSTADAARSLLATSTGASPHAPSLGKLGRSNSTLTLQRTVSPSKVMPMDTPQSTKRRGSSRAPRLTRHMKSLSSQNLTTPPPRTNFGAGAAFDRLQGESPARAGSFSSGRTSNRGGGARRATASTIRVPTGPASLGPMALVDFEVGPVIGRGGYAYVRVAQHHTGQWVALKCIKKQYAINRGIVPDMQSERGSAQALSRVSCPWLAHFFGTFQDSNTVYFAFEFVAGGELWSKLRSCKRFSEEVTRFYAAEVLLAIQAMHKNGYAYRDLKPENILIDKDGHCKVVDFGFTTPATSMRKMHRRVGTASYLAPEMLDKDVKTFGYTRVVDIWAFGCLLYEMLVGKAAFGKPGDPSHAIYMRIMGNKFSIPGHVSRNASDLVKQLLTPDLNRRLVDPEEIKGHAFFHGLDWNCFAQRRALPPHPPTLSADGDVRHFDLYSTSVDAKAASRWAKLRAHVRERPDFSAFG